MTRSRIASRVFAIFSIVLVVALSVLYVHPAYAARIFEDGFETGDFSKWSPVVGSPQVTSGNAHHGTYKAVLNTSSQYAQARFTLAPVDRCFIRAYVMFKSFPTSGTETTVLGVYNWASSRYMAEARVANVSGTIKWRLRYYHNGVHYTVTSEQQNPVLDTWYCVEVDGKSNSTTNSESRIYINGNELTDVSQTGRNNNLQITCGYIWANTAVTRWYDCVVIDSVYIGPECTLTVNVTGSGSVSKAPNQTVYDWGTNVTLTANPTIGWSFDHWSGDASGTANPITINMTSDKTVTATFTQNIYTFSVSAVGSGSVNLNNTGPYYYGDVVELTAVAAAGWSFQSWSGDLAGSANPTTLVIDGNKVVTATFTRNMYTLTVTVVGSGTVNRNNTGPYYYGDAVELTAVPVTGWAFQDWGGDLSGSANPSTILIDGDKTVTATFILEEYTLTVSTVGSGSVNLNNTGPYYYGDVVELTAVPSVGWSFDHWGGDLGGSANPTTILVDGNKAVTATFTQNVYTLTVTTGGSGSVNLNNTGPYHYGDVVQLTAVPSGGWSFQGWSGDLLGSLNPSTILINGNKAVTATFTLITYPLEVTIQPMTASISVGQSVLFTSTVQGGTTPYNYRWYLNGNPVSGATSSSWTFTPSAAGTHYVYLRVTDSSNTTVQSETARITVTSAPVGGYSVSLNREIEIKALALSWALIIGLALSMAVFRRKTRKD